MLIPPGSVRVLLASKPVDFRRGMDGLAALVKEQLRFDPFAGTLYIFRAKRADRVKIIFWDGSGFCLFSKRLERSKFVWPRIGHVRVQLNSAQLLALVDGLDWKKVRPIEIKRPEALAEALRHGESWRHLCRQKSAVCAIKRPWFWLLPIFLTTSLR